MHERDLHSLLIELHHGLQDAKPVNPETRELLERLAADIRPIVEQSAAGPIAGGKTAGLRERLGAAMAAVEASHPQLAQSIGRVADTLAFYNL